MAAFKQGEETIYFKNLLVSSFLENKNFSTKKHHSTGVLPFSPKHPILTENQNRIYSIPCSYHNLGCTGQTRRRLKAKMDAHRRKLKNRNICSSSIGCRCWPYNYFFYMYFKDL